jgi:hypothetical protein
VSAAGHTIADLMSRARDAIQAMHIPLAGGDVMVPCPECGDWIRGRVIAGLRRPAELPDYGHPRDRFWKHEQHAWVVARHLAGCPVLADRLLAGGAILDGPPPVRRWQNPKILVAAASPTWPVRTPPRIRSRTCPTPTTTPPTRSS